MLNIIHKHTWLNTEYHANERLLKGAVRKVFASQEDFSCWWLFPPLLTPYFHLWSWSWRFPLSSTPPGPLWVHIPRTLLKVLWPWIPVTSFRCNAMMSSQSLFLRVSLVIWVLLITLLTILFLPYSLFIFQLWLLTVFRWLEIVSNIICHFQ